MVGWGQTTPPVAPVSSAEDTVILQTTLLTHYLSAGEEPGWVTLGQPAALEPELAASFP